MYSKYRYSYWHPVYPVLLFMVKIYYIYGESDYYICG